MPHLLGQVEDRPIELEDIGKTSRLTWVERTTAREQRIGCSVLASMYLQHFLTKVWAWAARGERMDGGRRHGVYGRATWR